MLHFPQTTSDSSDVSFTLMSNFCVTSDDLYEIGETYSAPDIARLRADVCRVLGSAPKLDVVRSRRRFFLPATFFRTLRQCHL